jgi:hypothetical protein
MNRIGNCTAAFVVAALVAAGAAADKKKNDAADEVDPRKVYIDYDRSARLSGFKTFAVAAPPGNESLEQSAPVTHRHLLGAIRKRLLSAGRLTEDTSSPDIYVTYRVATKEAMDMSATPGYETGPGWRAGYYWAGASWGVSSTPADAYDVGTLVIDAWDAKAKRAVWRGVATDTITADPKKANKSIGDALDKLMKKWESMRAEGK